MAEDTFAGFDDPFVGFDNPGTGLVIEKPVGRTLTIFFVVDTSGSMNQNARIGAVNDAIDNCIEEIKIIQNSNLGQTIKIAVLSFDTDCRWADPMPVRVDDFVHKTLKAEGLTKFGAACKELNSKLSRTAFMQAAKASYAPVFILLSDGGPTDSWESGLAELKQNGWFMSGVRVAIDVDGMSKRDVLERFTGNPETVLESDGPDHLRKIIEFVSITSSMVASKFNVTDSTQGPTTREDPTDEIGEQFKNGVPGITSGNGADTPANPVSGDFDPNPWAGF